MLFVNDPMGLEAAAEKEEQSFFCVFCVSVGNMSV